MKKITTLNTQTRKIELISCLLQLYSICYFSISVLIADPVLDFEYYDLETVNTPVKVNVLKEWLIKSEYNISETKFLIDGFQRGSV